jgi:inhibitor of KinA
VGGVFAPGWVSDRALRVTLGDSPDVPTRRRVIRVARLLRAMNVPGVEDIVPASTTVTLRICAECAAAGASDVLRALEDALASSGPGEVDEPARLIEIPVCYDGEDFAPDLCAVGDAVGLTARRVVELHSGCEYEVAFLGFAPGFAYLGDVPEVLRVARLDTPRVSVPAGSVAIARRYTGVYPAATPGGWRLIGRTPVRMFDALRERASLLEPGDRVRFVPISRERFEGWR